MLNWLFKMLDKYGKTLLYLNIFLCLYLLAYLNNPNDPVSLILISIASIYAYIITGLLDVARKGDFFMGLCTVFGALFVIAAAWVQARGNKEANKLLIEAEDTRRSRSLYKELVIFTILTVNSARGFIKGLQAKRDLVQYIVDFSEGKRGRPEYTIDVSRFSECTKPSTWIIQREDFIYCYELKDLLAEALKEGSFIEHQINLALDELWPILGTKRLTDIQVLSTHIVRLYDDLIDLSNRTINKLETAVWHHI